MKRLMIAVMMTAAFAAFADVWYDENGVVVSGIGAASVTYRSESETNAWLDVTVAAGSEATLTALTPDPSVELSIRKLGEGSLALTNACGGFADLQVAAGSAILASAADVPGTTYLAGGELVAATNFTAGAIVLTADSAIRVAPGATLTTGDDGSYAALQVAKHTLTKLGDGKLNVTNPLNASGESGSTYIVEEGTFQVVGDCWGGHGANASGYTLAVHENGTVMATTHVPLPNVVMRGGRFVNNCAIPSDEQGLRIYKCWAMKHLIKVQASMDGSPSVISGYACHIGHKTYMPTFDIEAGAELQLDTMICNGEEGGGVARDSGFTKIGAGTLTFLRGGSITGESTLREGTLKFAAGASLGPDATLNTCDGTTIELADGAAFDTPVNSSLSCTAAEYAVLTNCAIWVDAWQETAAEGAAVQSIANRGAVGGVFAPPTSGGCTSPCTFTANGVNGRPSYRFNGSNQSMWFKDLAYGTASAPQREMMIYVAFERNSYVLNGYRGFFSFALSSNTANDNSSAYTLYHQDNGETNFGLYNKPTASSQILNGLNPCAATNGVSSVLTFYCHNAGRFTRIDRQDGGYNQNDNSSAGAFSIAFDRMALGARSNPYAVPRNPWDGAIGEVIVCTNYDSAVRDTLQAYMKRKWLSGAKGKKSGVAVIKVPQGTAAATSLGGLSDGRTPSLTKTGAGELMVGSIAADGDVVVTEGALSLIPTSIVSKIDVWMDADDEETLTVANGEVVSVRNKGRAGGSFVRNPRAGVSSTVSPNLPTLSTMNGHTALGFDGTRALVLDSYTNHNDDATFTVFVAARVGDDADFTVDGKGKEASPFSVSSIDSTNFDYEVPVGCHFETRGDQYVRVYSCVNGRYYNFPKLDTVKGGSGLLFAHYNHSYGALSYLQTFTNGVAAQAATKAPDYSVRPYPAALDVVSVGGRLGPKGTSYYNGPASTRRLWYGQVGELIVCTRQPTANERAAILAYLRAKWFLPGDAPATPSAIETTLAPSLDRNVALTVAGGTELKSCAATQPLSGLAVTGNATITRGGDATTAMFDISGDLLLPAGMTLSMLSEPEENASLDLITCSGTLDGSGTAWSIEARKPSRWSVETTQNAIRVLYNIPGTKLILR